jgi:hypothetical protein
MKLTQPSLAEISAIFLYKGFKGQVQLFFDKIFNNKSSMCPYYIPKSTAFYFKNCGQKKKFKNIVKSELFTIKSFYKV